MSRRERLVVAVIEGLLFWFCAGLILGVLLVPAISSSSTSAERAFATTVGVGVLILGCAIGAAFGYWSYRSYERRYRYEPCCEKCGYSLRGLTGPRCPECGTPVEDISQCGDFAL